MPFDDQAFRSLVEQAAKLKEQAQNSYRQGYRDALVWSVDAICAQLKALDDRQPEIATVADASADNSQRKRARARRGSVPDRILATLAQHSAGLTYNELHDITAIPLPSLRSAMRRLMQDERVLRREGRRFRPLNDDALDREEETEGAAKPTDDLGSDLDGGHHVAPR